MQNQHEQRVSALRRQMAEREIDCFVSLNPADNLYLTGFSGSTSAVVITAERALMLCDPRYTEQARAEVRAHEVVEVLGAFLKRTGEQIAALNPASVAFDPATLTVAQADVLEKEVSRPLTRMADAVGALRVHKDPGELAAIRAASELAEGVLADVLSGLREGVTEQALAATIDYEFKRRGASGPSFDTIVLLGERSSLPHGHPGERALRAGDIVLIDMGCRKAGYCSDLTRTFVFGRIPGTWFAEIYEIVQTAQQAALEAVRPGICARDVDAIARTIINDAGYGRQFGHGLGHGVGIEVHERPRLNFESDVILAEGMVVTIEPGIYLPERGGVRIEDLAMVTAQGCDSFTRSTKELKVLTP